MNPPTPDQRPWVSVRHILRDLFIGLVLISIALMFLLPLVSRVREPSGRMTSSNNLKQIGLAFDMYHDEFHAYPTNSFSPRGEPLLSWRVHLLPLIEHQALHARFKLDEPWDSPHNLALLPLMPRTYANPRVEKMPVGFTNYRGFSNRGAMLEPRFSMNIVDGIAWPVGVTMGEVRDGTTNTILLVEADEPVEWTKPEELDGANDPFPALFGSTGKTKPTLAVHVDGSVRSINHPAKVPDLRQGISYAGGD